MNNKENHLGQFITTTRKAQDLSENKLADNSTVPRSTLRRKLENPEDFTLDELTKISRVLGCAPSTLTSLHYATLDVAA